MGDSLPDRGTRVLEILTPGKYLKGFVKHFADLEHAIPDHVVTRFSDWAKGREIKPVDYSVDTVIADHYPFGKGEAPGGFSITVDSNLRWRWLAIGTGNTYRKFCPFVRKHRHAFGDSLEHFRAEAAKIRVMRYARTCKLPELEDAKDFKAVIVSGGYHNPATIIVSHLQFEPGVVDLVELIKGHDDPAATLKEAMRANPFNAVFVVEHFPKLAANDIREHVIEAVRALPLVAHRFPPGFLTMTDVDEGQCGELTHLLPVDQLCKTLDDVVHLFFHDTARMRPPLPWRWIRNAFGPDAVDTLAARIPPERLEWLPESMHTPERVDRWIITMETAERWDASQWLPDAANVDDARQFQRIIAITEGNIPPGTELLIPDDWWTEAEARLCMIHHMGAVPECLLTHDVLADFLRSNHCYSRVPEHLRTPDLDKVAVFEVTAGGEVYNYQYVKAPTLEMSRVYAAGGHSRVECIPTEHMADAEVIRGVCSNVFWCDAHNIYKKVPEARWGLVDTELFKRDRGLKMVPKDRRTDDMSRAAPIGLYEHMTATVRAERKAEHEAAEKKELDQRRRRMMWDDDDNDGWYGYDDWRPSPPASTAAQDAMAAELGDFYS